MFFKILPAPVLRGCFDRAAAKNDERVKMDQSLFADAGIELSYNIEDYPKDANGKPTGLYWRSTHEFPDELFEDQEPDFLEPSRLSEMTDDETMAYLAAKPAKPNPHLKSVGETLADYFFKDNWKAANPSGFGRMEMREVIIPGVSYVGKSSHHNIDPEEADDEIFAEEFDSQTFLEFLLWPGILEGVDLTQLSKATGIKEDRLRDITSEETVAMPAEGIAILDHIELVD
jgi:hypothetical protein